MSDLRSFSPFQTKSIESSEMSKWIFICSYNPKTRKILNLDATL